MVPLQSRLPRLRSSSPPLLQAFPIAFALAFVLALSPTAEAYSSLRIDEENSGDDYYYHYYDPSSGCANWFERNVLCHAINDRIPWTMKFQHRDLTGCPHRCQTCLNYDPFVALDEDAAAVFGRGFYEHEPNGSLYYDTGENEWQGGERLRIQIRYDESGNLYDKDWNELHDEHGNWLFDEVLEAAFVPWEMRHFYEHVHCARDAERLPNAWTTGDSDRMYERILRESDFADYSPTVLSRPADSDYARSTTSLEEDPDVGVGPWLIQMENLLTDAECDEMIAQTDIAISESESQSLSQSQSESDHDGERYPYAELADDRTSDAMGGVCQSTQAWCDPDRCLQQPLLKDVWSRIEDLVGLPFATHTEPVHFIKYVPGQKYGSHTDVIAEEYDSMAGPRLFTLLVYLNDVEEGGQTCFPQIERAYPGNSDPICVQPKRGRAILWPNIRNDFVDGKIERSENRTWHEAHGIPSGVKYASTVWYHLRNFSFADNVGCTDIYTDGMDEYDDEDYGEYDNGNDNDNDDEEYYDEDYEDQDEDEDEDEDNYGTVNEPNRFGRTNTYFRKYAGGRNYAGDYIGADEDEDELPMA